jgi:hypothetical protein
MKAEILAVHDRAAECYGRPFFVAALGQGIRSFSDEINNPQGEFGKHADDYDLFHIGTYDDVTGKVTSLETPKQLAIGKQLKIGA